MYKTPVDYKGEPQVVETIGCFKVVEVPVAGSKSFQYKVYNGRRIVGGVYGELADAVAFCHQEAHSPDSVESLTNKQLANLIERRDAAKERASGHVYDLAESGHERWSEIVERLGADDPCVVAYNEKAEEAAIARAEARRRLGPVQDVMFVTYLRNNRSRSN